MGPGRNPQRATACPDRPAKYRQPMKKLTVMMLAAATCAAAGASAQTVSAYKANVIDQANAVSYALPRTVLRVELTAQRTIVRSGPYARFAQRYLGVIAPLADKELYAITDARMTYCEEADPAQVYVLNNPGSIDGTVYTITPEGAVAVSPGGSQPARFAAAACGIAAPTADVITPISNILSDTSVVKVPINKKKIAESSLEEMAADAANTIFLLRKRKMELVTGEAGENVFGAGLEAALRTLTTLEEEYLALFMGKQAVQTVTRTYDVIPEAGKNNLIVCRFSPTAGLLADNDLSGQPIVLEITPEQKADAIALPRKAPREAKGTIYYRVADIARCRLVIGKNLLLDERVPVYQFGQVAEMPVPTAKK